MLKIEEIREIVKLIDQSDIEEFTFEQEGSKIKLKKRTNTQSVIQVTEPVHHQTPIVQQQVQPAVVTSNENELPETSNTSNTQNYHQITSPMVGTFYQSSSPDSPAYVQIGSKVNKNTVVCIVEAMKLFNEIEAEIEGEIVDILVKDGELVEFGQPLFNVKSN